MLSIRARMRAREKIIFEASPVARIIRRDWNFVSTKLYINALDREYRMLIDDDANELCWQVEDALEDTLRMPFERVDTKWMRPRNIELEIIHPIAAKWLRAMINLDKMYALLVSAEKRGLITRRKRHGFILPSLVAYVAFKSTATKMKFFSDDRDDLS